MTIAEPFMSRGTAPWRGCSEISRCDGSLAAGRSAFHVGLVVPHGFRVDRLALLRLQEVVGEAKNLKAVGIADDPQIQLLPLAVAGGNLDEARETRLLFDRSRRVRRPAPRSGKECVSRSRPLPVRDFRRVKGIADVVHTGAGA